MNIQQTLSWLRHQLPPEEASREAELMLCRVTGLTRTQLRTYPERAERYARRTGGGSRPHRSGSPAC